MRQIRVELAHCDSLRLEGHLMQQARKWWERDEKSIFHHTAPLFVIRLQKLWRDVVNTTLATQLVSEIRASKSMVLKLLARTLTASRKSAKRGFALAVTANMACIRHRLFSALQKQFYHLMSCIPVAAFPYKAKVRWLLSCLWVNA